MAARFHRGVGAALGAALTLAAPAGHAREGLAPDDARLRLECTGTMVAGAAPETPVVAQGFVDLAAHRVSGFGLGSTPIVRVSDATVFFGAPSAKPGVDGSLDRRTGAAHIRVHASGDPATVLIAMDLACGSAPVGS